MRYGLFVPPFGALSEPTLLVELAVAAEEAGWDGFFLWDHLVFGDDLAVAEPWVALSAIAARTRRLRLGPMVTPLVRHRPAVLARQAVTLDRLSGGRLVLGVGLGSDGAVEERAFGDEAGLSERAGVVDEALDVIRALWTGRRVEHRGPRFRAEGVRFLPTPVDPGGIPIWVAALGPSPGALERAARHDGVFAIGPAGPIRPEDIRQAIGYVEARRRRSGPFDVVVRGGFGPAWDGASRSRLGALAAAGVTWWLEAASPDEPLESVHALVRAGPPPAG